MQQHGRHLPSTNGGRTVEGNQTHQHSHSVFASRNRCSCVHAVAIGSVWLTLGRNIGGMTGTTMTTSMSPTSTTAITCSIADIPTSESRSASRCSGVPGAASEEAAPLMNTQQGAKHAWSCINRDPGFGTSWCPPTVVHSRLSHRTRPQRWREVQMRPRTRCQRILSSLAGSEPVGRFSNSTIFLKGLPDVPVAPTCPRCPILNTELLQIDCSPVGTVAARR